LTTNIILSGAQKLGPYSWAKAVVEEWREHPSSRWFAEGGHPEEGRQRCPLGQKSSGTDIGQSLKRRLEMRKVIDFNE
jgi:hypothetical protein